MQVDFKFEEIFDTDENNTDGNDSLMFLLL